MLEGTEMHGLPILVTKDDIANGEKGVHEKCPVALAISRETGLYANASYRDIRVGRVWMECPWRTRRWMLRFDMGHPVGRHRFKLKLLKQHLPAKPTRIAISKPFPWRELAMSLIGKLPRRSK